MLQPIRMLNVTLLQSRRQKYTYQHFYSKFTLHRRHNQNITTSSDLLMALHVAWKAHIPTNMSQPLNSWLSPLAMLIKQLLGAICQSDNLKLNAVNVKAPIDRDLWCYCIWIHFFRISIHVRYLILQTAEYLQGRSIMLIQIGWIIHTCVWN